MAEVDCADALVQGDEVAEETETVVVKPVAGKVEHRTVCVVKDNVVAKAGCNKVFDVRSDWTISTKMECFKM